MAVYFQPDNSFNKIFQAYQMYDMYRDRKAKERDQLLYNSVYQNDPASKALLKEKLGVKLTDEEKDLLPEGMFEKIGNLFSESKEDKTKKAEKEISDIIKASEKEAGKDMAVKAALQNMKEQGIGLGSGLDTRTYQSPQFGTTLYRGAREQLAQEAGLPPGAANREVLEKYGTGPETRIGQPIQPVVDKINIQPSMEDVRANQQAERVNKLRELEKVASAPEGERSMMNIGGTNVRSIESIGKEQSPGKIGQAAIDGFLKILDSTGNPIIAANYYNTVVNEFNRRGQRQMRPMSEQMALAYWNRTRRGTGTSGKGLKDYNIYDPNTRIIIDTVSAPTVEGANRIARRKHGTDVFAVESKGISRAPGQEGIDYEKRRQTAIKEGTKEALEAVKKRDEDVVKTGNVFFGPKYTLAKKMVNTPANTGTNEAYAEKKKKTVRIR